MHKTYYECPLQTGLAVPANSSKVFAIPYPTRVRLTSLRIKQTDGTLAAFRADLFKKEVGDAAASNDADDFWAVTPHGGIASTSSGMLNYDFADVDKFFDNKDDPVYLQGPSGADTPSLASVTAKRVIYLRITNAGSTNNTYQAMIGSEHASC